MQQVSSTTIINLTSLGKDVSGGNTCGKCDMSSISGLVAEYIVAIDVTRVRFPAAASNLCLYEAGCICVIPGWDAMCREVETVLQGEFSFCKKKQGGAED